jgi:hypothetical protein
MVRVRHYTRVSSMRRIIAELRIVARDQNKVFVELASSRRLPPNDAVAKYRLLPGKGNAYVEFDVEGELLRVRYNPAIKENEHYIDGAVDLAGRNAEAKFNF